MWEARLELGGVGPLPAVRQLEHQLAGGGDLLLCRRGRLRFGESWMGVDAPLLRAVSRHGG